MQKELPLYKIQKSRWYKPSEIAKEGLILTTIGTQSIQIINRLIRNGRLSVKNYSQGDKPCYLVKGSEIIRFRKERDNQFVYIPYSIKTQSKIEKGRYIYSLPPK